MKGGGPLKKTGNGAMYDEVKEHFRRFYKGIFPEGAGQLERHFQDTIDLEKSEKLLEEVRAAASLRPDSRILDIGCGFGTFVLACRKNGYRAWGVDSGAYEIDFAKKRYSAEVSSPEDGVYQRAPAEALPFEDGFFDAVTLWNLLEHVPDYRKVLDEAGRVLKKGGVLFIVSPNYMAVREEAHYHILWFSLMPRKLAESYLRIRGKDPEFFSGNIFYLTAPGISFYLSKKGYVLGADHFGKLDTPELCQSKKKAKIILALKRLHLKPLLRTMIKWNHFNPFRSVIHICARKR